MTPCVDVGGGGGGFSTPRHPAPRHHAPHHPFPVIPGLSRDQSPHRAGDGPGQARDDGEGNPVLHPNRPSRTRSTAVATARNAPGSA
jgi:hypothetical protein